MSEKTDTPTLSAEVFAEPQGRFVIGLKRGPHILLGLTRQEAFELYFALDNAMHEYDAAHPVPAKPKRVKK